jgi:hypothetical protein
VLINSKDLGDLLEEFGKKKKPCSQWLEGSLLE